MVENELNFNLYNSIILAGVVQGIIFGLVVFFSKKYRVKSTWYLAALITAFSLNNLTYYLLDICIISRKQFFLFLYFPNALLSPPLMYGYIKSYLEPHKKFLKAEHFLFLPFILFMAGSLVYRIAGLSGYQNTAFYNLLEPLPIYAEYLGILFSQIMLVYLFMKVQRHEKTKDSSSVIEGLNWLKWILGSLFLLSFVWAYEMAISMIEGKSRAFYMLWIGMSVMIYWLGHIGIYKFGVQQQRKNLRSYSIKSKVYPVATKERNEHIVNIEKLIIGEKRFLDANVTLDSIADELQLSKSHLSRIINAELGISFPDYINNLRVEEAKQYLGKPDFANYTLVAIGLEAGFNSKTTFNNAFKKCTGITPSQFKNSVGISPDN